jgi:hypothetical protein
MCVSIGATIDAPVAADKAIKVFVDTTTELTISIDAMTNIKTMIATLSKLYDDTVKNVALIQTLVVNPKGKPVARTDDMWVMFISVSIILMEPAIKQCGRRGGD